MRAAVPALALCLLACGELAQVAPPARAAGPFVVDPEPTGPQERGYLAPEAVSEVVREQRGLINACYDAGLRREPGLHGNITLRFVVAGDGSVARAGNAGSDLPPDVVGCIVGTFGALHFPRPEGGAAAVVYPLHFDPKSAAAATAAAAARPKEINGRLDPAVIQTVVRRSFGRVHDCYGAGLKRDPALTGRVMAKFVIGRDGTVTSIVDEGSDLPDKQVVACVLGIFRTLRFPEPVGGIVTVVYPVMFSPGGGVP